MQPGLSEAHELARRIVRTAEPGEGLGVPEEDVALETRRGRPALRQIGPRLLRLVVLLERVKRQGQAVANPRVGGGRQVGLLETPERVESTGTVAEAQCGEAAPKDGPRREIGGFAIGGDLTEEAIGFLEASEPIIGFAGVLVRFTALKTLVTESFANFVSSCGIARFDRESFLEQGHARRGKIGSASGPL